MPRPETENTIVPQEGKNSPAPTVPPGPASEKKKSTPWRFWFLVAFSLFLIVTFVFYLPLRFQLNVQPHEEGMPLMEEDLEQDNHPHEGDVEEDHHLNFIDRLLPALLADVGHDEEEPHEATSEDEHAHEPGTPDDHQSRSLGIFCLLLVLHFAWLENQQTGTWRGFVRILQYLLL